MSFARLLAQTGKSSRHVATPVHLALLTESTALIRQRLVVSAAMLMVGLAASACESAQEGSEPTAKLPSVPSLGARAEQDQVLHAADLDSTPESHTGAGGDQATPHTDGEQSSGQMPQTAAGDPSWPPTEEDPDLVDYDGPLDLVSAGLYEPNTQELAEGILTYEPRFPLWSDGAKKSRYLSLPPGTQIDTSDMDNWVFPVGTKAFKEFYVVGDGAGVETRVETRLLEKRADGSWFAISFVWNGTQTAARPRPYGEPGVLGTMHDVPAQEDCQTCHVATGDQILGIDAIQLSQPAGQQGLTLASLRSAGLLTVDPGVDRFDVPGDALAQEALGMMHSNCGSCHQPGNMAFERTDLELTLKVSELNDITATAAYRTSVGVMTEKRLDEWPLRIERGNGARSAMVGRMLAADPLVAMPPLARKIPDSTGAKALAEWIDSL